jgi:hypothetical protein
MRPRGFSVGSTAVDFAKTAHVGEFGADTIAL